MPEQITQSSTALAQSKIDYGHVWGNMLASQNGASFLSQITTLTHAGILFALKLVPVGVVTQSQYFSSIAFTNLTGLFANYAELKNAQVIFDKFSELQSPTNSVSTPTFKHKLALTDAHFSYGNQTVFDQYNVTIPKGEHFALIGASGKGKSTLLKILANHLPLTTGKLTLDGVDMTRQVLDSLVAYVPQYATIFNDSLCFNLTLGNPVSSQQLQVAVHHFYLEDIAQEGLDKILLEADQDLSGGQKQRIALARAYLQNKPILLLDEAMAAIDPKRARQIKDFLLSRSEQTILFSTHHLTPDDKDLLDGVIDLDA